jgi:hypothetical protein
MDEGLRLHLALCTVAERLGGVMRHGFREVVTYLLLTPAEVTAIS